LIGSTPAVAAEQTDSATRTVNDIKPSDSNELTNRLITTPFFYFGFYRNNFLVPHNGQV
jgi:hypothetical protein